MLLLSMLFKNVKCSNILTATNKGNAEIRHGRENDCLLYSVWNVGGDKPDEVETAGNEGPKAGVNKTKGKLDKDKKKPSANSKPGSSQETVIEK